MKTIAKNTLSAILIIVSMLECDAQETRYPWCDNLQLNYLSPGMYNFCKNGQWIVVFEDEFENDFLDLSKWRESPNQQGGLFLPNNSQEYRTLDNVDVSEGSMKIISKRETVYEKAFWGKPETEIIMDGLPNLRQYNYTSAYVESKFKIPYGKVEASVRIPKGRGFWPGFWLFSGDPWNEIDVFEFWNQYDVFNNFDADASVKTLNITTHYDIDNDGNKKQCETSYHISDASALDQIYSVAFNENRIDFYVNNVQKRYDVRYYTVLGQETGCQISGGLEYQLNLAYPIDPMRIIFSLYIQNTKIVNGIERDESPDETTPFPSQMKVNWVRYYQQHPYVDISITNYDQHPIENELYNVVAGRNVEFDCAYLVPNNQCLTILAENSVSLKPGFHAESGSTLHVKASQSLFGNSNTMSREETDQSMLQIGENGESNVNGECDKNVMKIDGNDEITSLTITPNPSIGIIQFELDNNNDCFDVNIYDLYGRTVYSCINMKGNNID